MAEKLLNQHAYTVEPDNLVRATEFPALHRVIEITNPKTAIKRGQTVVFDGTKAEAKCGGAADANIVGIVSADHDADAVSEKVSVDCFTSGAFNAGKVVGPTVTAAVQFGAQSNGIYIY